MPSDDLNKSFQTAAIELKMKEQEEGVVGEPIDPLKINIDDDELVDIVDDRISKIHKYYKKIQLYERRKKNEIYRFGRQIDEEERAGTLKSYESRNLDNVIYEIEATLKPLAMSQLPDLLVTPGSQSQESKDTSLLLTKAVDNQIKARENRKVLGLSFQHRSVYFVGVIKAMWDPQAEGGMGDYRFEVIHPDLVEVDPTSTSSNADDMSIIPQIVPITIRDCFMRFPEAKDKLIQQLKIDGILSRGTKEPSYKDLATEIKIREVWFTDYRPAGDGKYERVEGVLWKYKDVILKKMKNPNFDYEGHEQLFTYGEPGVESTKVPITMQDMQQSMATGVFPSNLASQQVYNNYFSAPRKPYFFVTYDQWGKQPLDETTALEQNIRNQETLDRRVKQINETLNSRGHFVWSKEGGLQPDDIELMDHNNPDQDYLVAGNPSQQFAYVPPIRPTPDEYKDTDRVMNRMYAISGSTAVRGTLQTDVATSNQIAREANYTRADDLVDDTINPAAEWMAQWALQFIKLRYTQAHFRWLMGQRGELLYARLHQDMIDDGMIVKIKASGTDKLKAQNNALNNAKIGMVDPLSFFRDMGYDDAETRTVMLMAFKANPAAYLQSFLKDNENVTPDLLAKLDTIAPPPQQPTTPGTTQGATPTNTANVPINPPPMAQPNPLM